MIHKFERASGFNDTAHMDGHEQAQYRRHAGERISSPYRYHSPSRSPSRTLYRDRIGSRTAER